MPVYNQAGTIVENVGTIRERVESGLGEPIELIVVSDGSVDASEELLLGDSSHRARVIHYQRNLGKGYAIKAGAVAAAGRWIAYIDADLDIDPAAIPKFLVHAQAEGLDFAIGSKRHPESRVHYPATRRVSSWLFQQVVRLLFQLDVRDTQVGIKVFRREIADEVMPLLLVKQYAFDLELLAVANAFGFRAIKELPIALDYRFTGSGVRSIAVFHALLDTAAIFYRLRILQYYQRRRALLIQRGVRRASDDLPSKVTLVTTDRRAAERLEYHELEVVEVDELTPLTRSQAAEHADGDVVAFIGRNALPAGNWLDSTVPFLDHPEIAAVVVPTMTPAEGSSRERAAGAVWESRLGGGSLHFRFTPGNLRFVEVFPAETVVVRRKDLLELDAEDASEHRLVVALTAQGRRVLYTPDTVVVRREPPLFRPHLRKAASFGRGRGQEVGELGMSALRPLTLAPMGVLALAVGSAPMTFVPLVGRRAVAAAWVLYGALVVGGAASASVRHRSLRVGMLTAAGSVATHLTYGAAFVQGLVRGARSRR